MNNFTKGAVAALSLLTLSLMVFPSVFAQNAGTTAAGTGQGAGAAVGQQEDFVPGAGRFERGEGKQLGLQWQNLTLEEQKAKIAEQIDRTIENLESRLENADEHELLAEDVRTQLEALIKEHLANLPGFKAQVQAAADQDALDAVLEAMRSDGRAMQKFMQENRPSREQIEAYWDGLTFDEKQEHLLSKVDGRLENLNELKTKISSATTDEELDALRGPGNGMGFGMGPEMDAGMGEGRGIRGPGNGMGFGMGPGQGSGAGLQNGTAGESE